MTGRFIGDYSNETELLYRDTGKILNDSKVNTIEVLDTSSKVSLLYIIGNKLSILLSNIKQANSMILFYGAMQLSLSTPFAITALL